MVDYQYDNNVYKDINRRRRRRAAIVVFLFVLLLVILYVIWDGLSTQTTISQPSPQNETLGQSVEQKVFDKPTFKLTTDTSWVEVENRDDRYEVYTFQSIDNGLVVRVLDVYINGSPPEIPVTYVLPVETRGSELTPLAISPKCDELQPMELNKRDIQLEWAGVSFLCDPDMDTFVAAASHNETGYDVNLKGTLSDASYTFVYLDRELTPQPSEFQQLLRDFKAK